MPPLSQATVTLWSSASQASATLPNQQRTVWSAPNSSSPSYRLLRHGLQPAGEDDAERAGLASAVGAYVMFCENADLTPQQRIRVSGSALFPQPTDFVVRASWEWHNHTQAVLERL